MEAVVVIFLVIIIVCWSFYKRKLVKAVYGIASLEIALQVFAFLSRNVNINSISKLLSNIPNSLLVVADKYTSGIVYTILAWAFILLMIYFMVVTVRTFFKK